MLAQSELEEQTTLSAKLKEVAAAKGAMIPGESDAATMEIVNRVQNLSADEVNAFYIKESGIKGHQLLKQTMNTVKGNASDDNMKTLAKATLPVINTHLKVSKQIDDKMK